MISIGMVGGLSLAPAQGQNVAVVFPPWVDQAQASVRAAQAGLTLVHTGRYPFVVIAKAGSADFYASAIRNGALVVLGARRSRGCGARVAAVS